MSIKREPALQPLSRDHLIALLHAYRLVQASSGNPRFGVEECIDGFKGAWKEEIAVHFADEERLFLSLNVSSESLERLFAEHAALRELVLRLHLEPSGECARELGELLERHVRWEEHVLFPEIENGWSEEQRMALEKDTSKIEKSRDRKRLPREGELPS